MYLLDLWCLLYKKFENQKEGASMAKQKNLEDIYYPVPQNFCITQPEKPPINRDVIKLIIRGAVKGAYRLKNPSLRDYHGNPIRAKPVATQEQMDMIVHLIESLQPSDAIEAALASQFAITYIRGMEESSKDYSNSSTMIELFEFGHQVLESYQKYRSKGAQQISVQYNVNQGQVVNIKNVRKEDQPITLEGSVI
jgi:hypothetical protein